VLSALFAKLHRRGGRSGRGQIAAGVANGCAAGNADEGPAAPAGAAYLWWPMRSRAVVPEVSTGGAAISMRDGLAAPAGTTSLSSEAAPCYSAGWVHLQCCCQPARRASGTSRPYISFEQCGAMPSGQVCSLTVLPAACATGRPRPRAYISFERGGVMSSCRTGSPTVLLSACATGPQHQ